MGCMIYGKIRISGHTCIGMRRSDKPGMTAVKAAEGLAGSPKKGIHPNLTAQVAHLCGVRYGLERLDNSGIW